MIVSEHLYDELNRQVSRALPDELTETMHYNDTPLSALSNPASSVGLGQVEYSVDFEGRVTAYRYDNTADGGGRSTGKFYYTALAAYTADAGDGVLASAAQTVTYKQDALGRTVEINDSNFTGATTQAYDTFGRLTQIASPQGIINYGYTTLGQKNRTWTSHGTTGSELSDAITDTLYTYDVLGRLKTVQAVERNDVAVTESATEYRYDTNGNLSQVELPNGVIQDYLYDELNRLVGLRHFNRLFQSRCEWLNDPGYLTNLSSVYYKNLRDRKLEYASLKYAEVRALVIRKTHGTELSDFQNFIRSWKLHCKKSRR